MKKNQIKIPNALTGVTANGEVKGLTLDLFQREEERRRPPYLAGVSSQGKGNPRPILAEEYLLINKLPEAGVKIKARLKGDDPSFPEKILFMLGEACFAGAMDAKKLEQSEKGDFDYFKNYMEALTKAVIEFHKGNEASGRGR